MAPRADHAPAPGDTIGGFRVTRVTRRGDGDTTLAEGVDAAGRPVALVVLSARSAADPRVRDRLARLQALKTVTDAPLAPLAGVGQDGGRPYVAWARPRGRTLADRLADGPLEPRETARLLAQVAGALETLRRFGIPCASVAPPDILIARLPGRTAPEALLTDYGFAPPASRAAERPWLLDRADYLAPETARGAPAGPAALVYSLACVLVECLTGAPPFPYARPLEVLHAHLVAPPPRISQRVPLPPMLDAVVATALSKSPETRQRSAPALLTDVQRALGVPVAIPVFDPPRPTPADLAPMPASRPVPRAEPAAEAAPAPRPRPRRNRGPRVRPAPATIALGLAVVIGTAGFAAGNRGTDGRQTPSPAASAAARAAAVEHAFYVRAVRKSVSRLRDQRALARRRLRAAPDARAQATAARTLEERYAAARRSLPPHAGVLAVDLSAAERAYGLLADAARAGDARAFRAARRDVLAREQRVNAALRGVARADGPSA